jgi:ABC-type multidrug transport system ATPase subunit
LIICSRTDTPQGEPVLQLEDLVLQRDGLPVLGSRSKPLSFILRDGELGIMLAPNGWGKTTLLEAIAGNIPPASGRIVIQGRVKADGSRANRAVRLLPATNNVFPDLTVAESLDVARAKTDAFQPSLLRRRVATLSGGEQQRVAIASVVAAPSISVRLLDEPFTSLDHAAIAALQDLLTPQRGLTTLIALPGTTYHENT